jgi:hypothetical protein
VHFDPFHNHKWARNLAHARRLLEQGALETFYRGENLPGDDIYPGMRVMSAYWISVEHEMKMRLETILRGSGHPEWREDAHLLTQRDEFSLRFQEDMRFLVDQECICTQAQLDDVICESIETPANWQASLHEWQVATEAGIAQGSLAPELVEAWFASCLRSLANYNHYLIWGGVIAAALVKAGGEQALRRAVDATSEEFMWAISREFYAHVLPAAGFEDLGDVMELGMRGMYSDQYYQAGEEEQREDEVVIKHSLLKNCELAGIYQRVAEWNHLPTLALGYGICRYCEVHGAATMMISIPPMYAPEYRLVESHGVDGKPCAFELVLTPADDMERLMMVQEKVFGENE